MKNDLDSVNVSILHHGHGGYRESGVRKYCNQLLETPSSALPSPPPQQSNLVFVVIRTMRFLHGSSNARERTSLSLLLAHVRIWGVVQICLALFLPSPTFEVAHSSHYLRNSYALRDW